MTEHTLQLLGPDEAGRVVVDDQSAANLYIGPTRQPKSVPQVLADVDHPVAFDALPDDGWPTALYYEGNRAEVFEWASGRHLRSLSFTPSEALEVDASAARIDELELDLSEPMGLVVPDVCHSLRVRGAVAGLSPTHVNEGADLRHGVTIGLHGGDGRLPFYEGLRRAPQLTINCTNTWLDAESLEPWSHVTGFRIRGGLKDASVLARFTALETLELREVYGLEAFPPLETWPALRYLVVHDVPKGIGGRIRKEARALARGGTLTTARVSGLRSPAWIRENALSPFRSWPRKPRRAANAALGVARKGLTELTDSEAVTRVITEFTEALNALHDADGLMTTEREDAAWAVRELLLPLDDLDLLDAGEHAFDATRRF